MPTKNSKSEDWQAYCFDSVSADAAFDNVASVGAAVASTTVQARWAAPTRLKIPKVVVNFSAIAASTGTHKFNIVIGTGAELGVAIPDDTGRYVGATAVTIPGGIPSVSVAAAGQSLWAADQTLLAVADTPTVFIPTNYDGIIEQGTLLTLRVVTPASTGSISNLKVQFVTVVVDPYPMQPPGYQQQLWAVPSAISATSGARNGW
jgi:hypothetical protein